jgi:predicted Zn-dependent peptidase
MLLHSVFDPVELDREKNVVLEEIKHHEDDPEELVHDLFARHVWPDHPLGRTVIGYPEVVSAFNADKLRGYMEKWYSPERMIVAVAGQIDEDRILDLIGEAFGSLEPKGSPHRTEPLRPASGDHLIFKETEQVNLCIGTPGLTQQSEDRYALACLDTAYGGGMSSRLFQEVREARGLAYSIGSYFTSYDEGGLFTVFAGTSPETMEEVVQIVREEGQRLCEGGLTEAELTRSKNQIKGSLLMGLESMSNRMSRLGKTELYFGRVITVEEVVSRIEALTTEEVHRVAQTVLGGPVNLTAIGPFEESKQMFDSTVDKAKTGNFSERVP